MDRLSVFAFFHWKDEQRPTDLREFKIEYDCDLLWVYFVHLSING